MTSHQEMKLCKLEQSDFIFELAFVKLGKKQIFTFASHVVQQICILVLLYPNLRVNDITAGSVKFCK